jgi:hypothetical protein
VVGLLLLKHIYGLSDEGVCERWVYDPYFQHFTGFEFFQHDFTHERSDLSHWRKRLGDKLELVLAESLRVAHEAGALRTRDLKRVTVDTTVQPKAITFPTDAKLVHAAIKGLNRLAREHGVCGCGNPICASPSRRDDGVTRARATAGAAPQTRGSARRSSPRHCLLGAGDVRRRSFICLIRCRHAQLTDLTLAGGRAMNSVANGKVRRSTLFQRLYVQSAAGDAGGAIGAAYWTWHRLGGARSFVMDHAYWGPHFDTGGRCALNERSAEIADAGCTVETIVDAVELCRRTALVIAER